MNRRHSECCVGQSKGQKRLEAQIVSSSPRFVTMVIARHLPSLCQSGDICLHCATDSRCHRTANATQTTTNLMSFRGGASISMITLWRRRTVRIRACTADLTADTFYNRFIGVRSARPRNLYCVECESCVTGRCDERSSTRAFGMSKFRVQTLPLLTSTSHTTLMQPRSVLPVPCV